MRYVVERLKSGQFAVCNEAGVRVSLHWSKASAVRKKNRLETRARNLRKRHV